MGFVAETALAVVRIALGFYGFWFVWRALLPALPGPNDSTLRIADFACYFTDPIVAPFTLNGRLPTYPAVIGLLVAIGAGQVLLARLESGF